MRRKDTLNYYTVVKKDAPFNPGETVLVQSDKQDKDWSLRLISAYRSSPKFQSFYIHNKVIYSCYILGADNYGLFTPIMLDDTFNIKKKDLKSELSFCHLLYANGNGDKRYVWNFRDADAPKYLLFPDSEIQFQNVTKLFIPVCDPFHEPKEDAWIIKDYSEKEIDSYCRQRAAEVVNLSKNDDAFGHLSGYSFDHFYNQFKADFVTPQPILHKVTKEDVENRTYIF